MASTSFAVALYACEAVPQAFLAAAFPVLPVAGVPFRMFDARGGAGAGGAGRRAARLTGGIGGGWGGCWRGQTRSDSELTVRRISVQSHVGDCNESLIKSEIACMRVGS